jgi:zinc protease
LLVLVGDVDTDEVLPLAERMLAGWEGAPPALPEITGRPRFTQRSVHVIDRPGAVQSELRIGQPGISRNTPDHAALVVANAVLGGTFTSRLNLNLRERNGFTYGVRSRFAFRRGPGPFSISTAIDTDVTASAVREALFELDRFVADGPDEDELVAVRDYIAGVFPLQLETTGQVAGRVAELLVYGLPDSAWVSYRDDIRAVDVEAAHRAFAKVVQPEQATVVVVGDAERVRPELEALAIGPVTVHQADAPAS